MNRPLLKLGAAAGVLTISTLAVGPALAAPIVSQATANALTLSIGGTPNGTGTFSATNDGSGEVTSGNNTPPISVLDPQNLLNVGTLAQDATATLDGRDGVSAACAGVAGSGASVAGVGGSSCLTGGENIGLTLGNLDLTGMQAATKNSALAPLNAATDPILTAVAAPVTKAVSDALASALGGEVGVTGSLGVVESHCTAAPGTASGNGSVTELKVAAALPGGTNIVLADVPIGTAPNQDVVVGLDKVTQAVIDGVKTDLANSLGGVLDPLGAVGQTLQDQIIEAAVAGLQPLLQQVDQNILNGTINKQTKTADTIKVTALELKVLPAAAQALGAPLAQVDLATVTCGPNARLGVTPSPSPSPSTPASNPGTPDVPTKVESGLAGDNNPANAILAATAALLAMAGSGAAAYRRLKITRG